MQADALGSPVIRAHPGSFPAMTASTPRPIPADALRLLGQLTTALAGGDRQAALAVLGALQTALLTARMAPP